MTTETDLFLLAASFVALLRPPHHPNNKGSAFIFRSRACNPYPSDGIENSCTHAGDGVSPELMARDVLDLADVRQASPTPANATGVFVRACRGGGHVHRRAFARRRRT